MASACALAIFSGKIIFNRAMPERLRTLRHCIFTGGVVEGNSSCRAAFYESAALRGSTPSVIAYGDATFPKGTAFRGGGKLCGSTERRPLGGAGKAAGFD